VRAGRRADSVDGMVEGFGPGDGRRLSSCAVCRRHEDTCVVLRGACHCKCRFTPAVEEVLDVLKLRPNRATIYSGRRTTYTCIANYTVSWGWEYIKYRPVKFAKFRPEANCAGAFEFRRSKLCMTRRRNPHRLADTSNERQTSIRIPYGG
jgi:hypothetical protein